MKMQALLSGAALSCLLLSTGGCASKPRPIETRTIEVEKPVFVAVPENLTAPVPPAPVPDLLTNLATAGLAKDEKCRRVLANCQLERIENLQPGGPRRVGTECERYEKVCRAIGK